MEYHILALGDVTSETGVRHFQINLILVLMNCDCPFIDCMFLLIFEKLVVDTLFFLLNTVSLLFGFCFSFFLFGAGIGFIC